MPNKSIIILASRSQNSYLLINYLAKHFDIAYVIFESRHSGKMLRYRLRKLGLIKVLGQLIFLAWDRLYIRRASQPRIKHLLAQYDVRPPDGRISVVEVQSINTPEVMTLLQQQQPSVIVVSGTGIIARHVLELGPIFINIHCGITPRYRGVHGAFWAVYEDRPELAGTTIHQVDPGVDTGAIIGQAAIEIDPRYDTYRTLPVKQYLAGLRLMSEAVHAALDSTLVPYQRNDLESKQWYSPDMSEYLRFLLRLRSLRR